MKKSIWAALTILVAGVVLFGLSLRDNFEGPAFDIGHGWKARFTAVGVGHLDYSKHSHNYLVLSQLVSRIIDFRSPGNTGCGVDRNDDKLIIAFRLTAPAEADHKKVPFHPNIEIVDSHEKSYLHTNVEGEWCGNEGYAVVISNDTAKEPDLHFRVINPDGNAIWYETTVRNPVAK